MSENYESVPLDGGERKQSNRTNYIIGGLAVMVLAFFVLFLVFMFMYSDASALLIKQKETKLEKGDAADVDNSGKSGVSTPDKLILPIMQRQMYYYTEIAIGSPDKKFSMLLDGTTTKVWVEKGQADGNRKKYDSKYSIGGTEEIEDKDDLSSLVYKDISFTSGLYKVKLSGTRFRDIMHIGPLRRNSEPFTAGSYAPVDLTNQAVPDATVNTDMIKMLAELPFDGVIGIGAGIEGSERPVLKDFLQNANMHMKYGIWLNKDQSEMMSAGELCLGCMDSARFSGDVTYAVPAEKPSTSSKWNFKMDTVFANYPGDEETSIAANPKAYINPNALKIGIPRAVFSTLPFAATSNCESRLPSFNFRINNVDFVLDPDMYRQYNNRECMYLLEEVEEEYWVLGSPFMRNFYSVFDLQKKMVGFAKSK